MNEYELVQIVTIAGCLALAGSALASHRMSMRKGLVMALAWGAVFLAVFFVFDLLRR